MGILDSVSSAVSSGADAVAATARAADLSARVTAEAGALRGYFLPESFVTWYQSERAYLGFEPPTLAEMPVFLVAIPMVIGIIFAKGYQLIMGGEKVFVLGLEGKLKTDISRIMFILVCIFLLILTFFLVFHFFGKSTATYNDLASAQAKIGTNSGFQNPNATPTTESIYKLVNIQPLAIKQTGFVGPAENNGSFDPVMGIQTAIRAGVTFFTLQIDYLQREKDSKLFDKIGVPTLLYRNSSGKLISNNGASIASIAQQLANYMFNPDLRVSKYPIIVYLHFVRTPNPITKPNDYLNFLKAVADALKPIQPFILADGTDNYRRQKSETALLQLTLTTLNKSVILMSNADTTIFRNTQATGGGVAASSDLDSLINMRVYLDDPTDTLGVTQVATNTSANAVIVSYDRLNEMSDTEKATFAMKGKNRFVIAMPKQLDNPSYSDIKSLLKNTGVNAIPINLIGTDPAPVNKIISLWESSMPFYMVKQMMLQSFAVSVRPNSNV